MGNTITLESLLDTHDQPFVVIDASLTIIAVNRAYELVFATPRHDVVGKPCCADVPGTETAHNPSCRHRKLYHDLEPYAEWLTYLDAEGSAQMLRVRGYPLVDADGTLLLGEAIIPAAVPGRSQDSPKMAGRSAAFMNLIQRLDQAAAADVPVLLQGETGTGKELAAEYVHTHSQRKDKEFVVVDCTVLGEDLFESELFGHEKGAFTGAAGPKKGLFQLADGGTLFLDEIGELPLSQQPKLLRALETGTFRRVGGTQTLRANVRVISATHRDIDQLVQTGDFRQDLFYRLSVFPVKLPPLRERSEDIPLIAQFFLGQMKASTGKTIHLTPRALDRLSRHPFPGNIRELRNVLQLAVALCQQGLIDAGDIHLRAIESSVTETPSPKGESTGLTEEGELSPIENVEAGYIVYLLKKHAGNRQKVAFEMGISERTLYRKLKRYKFNLNNLNTALI